ncbi:MAG: hypothetical protein FD137_1526 [Spirochaetes bacterium]|nr:MAG: hypothetical protein FD137_1526 [Spirochaetota bacterium]
MQKWFSAHPNYVEAGDRVRHWDYDHECYVTLEVKKVCTKTFLVLKYDNKMDKYRSVYIPHDKLGIVPREVTNTSDTPNLLQNISMVWKKLAEKSEDSGYFTHRAGFYFIYNSKLWFLYAPGYREGHYLPYVETIHQNLLAIGATSVVFDEGDLD